MANILANLLTRNTAKPKAPASSIDEIIAERAKRLSSPFYRIARLHESQGAEHLTPVDRQILAWEQESKARLDQLSAQRDAERETKLVSERFGPAAIIKRGGFIPDKVLNAAAIEDPALRKNAAREVLAEIRREGTEFNNAFMNPSHPDHQTIVESATYLTKISTEEE